MEGNSMNMKVQLLPLDAWKMSFGIFSRIPCESARKHMKSSSKRGLVGIATFHKGIGESPCHLTVGK